MRHLLLGFALGHRGSAAAQIAALPKPGPGQAVPTLAGGCFWRTDADFGKVPGLIHHLRLYWPKLHCEQVSADGTGRTEPKGEG